MPLCQIRVAGNSAYCAMLHHLLIVLLQTHNLAEQIVMTADHSWCSWSVCVSAVRYQKELISHDAVVIVKYSECVSVLLLVYPACRPQR